MITYNLYITRVIILHYFTFMHSYDVRKYAPLVVIMLLLVLISFSVVRDITGFSTANFDEEEGYVYSIIDIVSTSEFDIDNPNYVYEIDDNGEHAFVLYENTDGEYNIEEFYSDENDIFSRNVYSGNSKIKHISPTRNNNSFAEYNNIYVLKQELDGDYMLGQVSKDETIIPAEEVISGSDFAPMCADDVFYLDAVTMNDGTERVAFICASIAPSLFIFKQLPNGSYEEHFFMSLSNNFGFDITRFSFDKFQSEFDKNSDIFYLGCNNSYLQIDYFNTSTPIINKNIFAFGDNLSLFAAVSHKAEEKFLVPKHQNIFLTFLTNSSASIMNSKINTFFHDYGVANSFNWREFVSSLNPNVFDYVGVSQINEVFGVISINFAGGRVFDIEKAADEPSANSMVTFFDIKPNPDFFATLSGAINPDIWMTYSNNYSSAGPVSEESYFYFFKIKELSSSDSIEAKAKIHDLGDGHYVLNGSESSNFMGELVYCPEGNDGCLQTYFDWKCLNCRDGEINYYSGDFGKSQIHAQSSDLSLDYAFELTFTSEYYSDNSVQELSTYDYVYTSSNILENLNFSVKQNSQTKTIYLANSEIDFETNFNCYGSCRVEWDFGDSISDAVVGSPKTSHKYSNTGTYLVSAKVTVGDKTKSVSKKVYVINSADLNSLSLIHPKKNYLNPEYVVGEEIDFSYSFPNMDKIPSNLITQKWDFNGDGSTDSTLSSLSYSYSASGKYNAVLNVSVGEYSKENSSLIRVFSLDLENPEVVITAPSRENNVYSTSDELEFQFDFELDVTPENYIIYWDFDGDGSTDSTALNPSYSYSSTGAYEVNASFVYNGEIYGSALKTIYVLNPADFSDIEISRSEDKTTYAINENIDFSYSFPNMDKIPSNLITQEWDFDGDGSTDSTASIPSHSYSNTGQKKVTLTLDSGSMSKSKTDSFYVIDSKNAEELFIVSPAENKIYPVGETLDFQHSYSDENVEYDTKWDFGDDSAESSDEQTTHSYSKTEKYYPNVTLTIASQTYSEESSVYVLDFNDLETLSMDISSETGVFVPGEPINFSFDFDNKELLDSKYSVLWNFGDGESSDLEKPSNEFENDGRYLVELRIDANKELGLNYSISKEIVVIDENSLDALYIDLEPKKNFYTSENEIEFSSSIDFADSYSWKFGDEFTSSINPDSHNYSDEGIYSVLLKINVDGKEANASKTIYVANLTKLGNVDVNVSPKKSYYMVDEEIAFSPTYNILESVLWDFGDGETSNEKEATHTYLNESNYVVSFDISLSNTKISVSKQIPVLGREPKPVIDGEITSLDVPSKIKLSAEDSFDADNEITKAVWDFGLRTSPWGVIDEAISGDMICSPIDDADDAPCGCPSDKCIYEGEFDEDELGNPCTCIEQFEYIYPSSIVESSNYEMPVFPFYNTTDDCSYDGFVEQDYCVISLTLEDESGNIGYVEENLTFSGKINSEYYTEISCSSEYNGTYDCTGEEFEGNVEFTNAVTSCCCPSGEDYVNGSCQVVEETSLSKDFICADMVCLESCDEGYELVEDDDNICCDYKCQINIDYLDSSSSCPSSCEEGFEKVRTPESSCSFACVVKESSEKKSLFSSAWFWIVMGSVSLGILAAVVFLILKINSENKEGGLGGSDTSSSSGSSDSSAGKGVSSGQQTSQKRPAGSFKIGGKKITYRRTKKY